MPRRALLSGLLLPALAAVLVACSGGGAKGAATDPEPPRPSAGENCPNYGNDGGKPVYFGANGGTNLAGILFGTGSRAVVFAHESDDDGCDWEPNAAALAKRGYRTLIFDFHDVGSSLSDDQGYDGDVVAAANFVRSQGATSVVLVGASMGGTAVLAAATELAPQPVAVVALSAPSVYGGVDAIDVVSKITGAALLIVGSLDTEFVESVRSLEADATSSSHKQLLIVESGLHGFRLIQPVGSNEPAAIAAFDAFLAGYAPPV